MFIQEATVDQGFSENKNAEDLLCILLTYLSWQLMLTEMVITCQTMRWLGC